MPVTQTCEVSHFFFFVIHSKFMPYKDEAKILYLVRTQNQSFYLLDNPMLQGKFWLLAPFPPAFFFFRSILFVVLGSGLGREVKVP